MNMMQGTQVCSRPSAVRAFAPTKRAVSRLPRSVLRPRAVAEPTAVPFLSSADHLLEWDPQSWRNYTALQQPNYPDKVGVGNCACLGAGSGDPAARLRGVSRAGRQTMASSNPLTTSSPSLDAGMASANAWSLLVHPLLFFGWSKRALA